MARPRLSPYRPTNSGASQAAAEGSGPRHRAGVSTRRGVHPAVAAATGVRRSLLLVGNGQYGQSRVLFEPGERDAGVEANDKLVVRLPPATAQVLAEPLRAHVGNYAVAGLPITFAVGPTVIAA